MNDQRDSGQTPYDDQPTRSYDFGAAGNGDRQRMPDLPPADGDRSAAPAGNGDAFTGWNEGQQWYGDAPGDRVDVGPSGSTAANDEYGAYRSHSTDELDATRPVHTSGATAADADATMRYDDARRDEAYRDEAYRDDAYRDEAYRQRLAADDAPTQVVAPVTAGERTDRAATERDRRPVVTETQPDYGLDSPAARLQAADRGATPTGRALSVVSVLVILGILGFVGWDLTRGADSMIGGALDLAGQPPLVTYLEMIGLLSLAFVLIGLTLGWSGLGALVGGVFVAAAGATIFLTGVNKLNEASTSADADPTAIGAAIGNAVGTYAGGALVPFGLLLMAAGIGAHFARRGGFKRAIQILNGRVD